MIGNEHSHAGHSHSHAPQGEGHEKALLIALVLTTVFLMQPICSPKSRRSLSRSPRFVSANDLRTQREPSVTTDSKSWLRRAST